MGYIRVGDIIDNIDLQTEFAFKIGTWNDDQDDWETLYDSRQTGDDLPAELLNEKITFMTIVDDQLILEVRG